MHRPAWKLIAVSAAALTLGACGSDSTGPSTKLTDIERASLISSLTTLADSLNANNGGNIATGLQDVAIALGANSDVSVTTISAASLARMAPGISAVTQTNELSGAFRVLGIRSAQATGTAGDSLIAAGLVAWQDSSTVVFALKFADSTATIDSTGAAVAGIFVAPWSGWRVTAGTLSASPRSVDGTCTSNPATAQGFQATCQYMTMNVALNISASAPDSYSRNTATGSITGQIQPMAVHGINFIITGSNVRRTMY